MFEYNITKKHYHTLDYYLKTKYNKKVFKVPLNASFTCPNRDGKKGYGGCAFCSSVGSGDFAGNPKDDLMIQFETIKANIEKKWPDSLNIVYFQAFSNTYGSIEKLKETFEPFINKENVIGMSIATRCDCINEEVVNYLKTLKKHFKEFWVELGLQSANKKTMELLNLGYTYKEFKDAVNLLAKANIDVIVHIIDGLPFESKQDQINTILKINKLKFKGLKIHVLNVIENTKIAKMYLNNEFEVMSEEEFIDTSISQLLHLKDDVIIHRIGADSKVEDLIAPTWVSKKMSLIDKIDVLMDQNDLYQGEYY